MKGNEKENKTPLNISNLLKKGAVGFGYCALIVAAIFYFYADKVLEIPPEIYKKAFVFVSIAYIIVFFVAVIVSIIFNIYYKNKIMIDKNSKLFERSIDKINNTNEELTKNIDRVCDSIGLIKPILKDNGVSNYVLDKEEVIDLEGSVGNISSPIKKYTIYIQSSAFTLEKGPLKETIIWNLRKGVLYKYMIPMGDYIFEYYRMIKEWYKDFSIFLNSKEEFIKFKEKYDNNKYGENWSEEYSDLVCNAETLWEGESMANLSSLKRQCQDLFLECISANVDDLSKFYVTIAMYELDDSKWEAIIKLPTEDPESDYFAFKIPNENKTEKDKFVNNFKNLYKSHQFSANRVGTYGGKLNIDKKRIFD